jgi:circadian clock protein KaiB
MKQRTKDPMLLRLYVAGDSANSVMAKSNLLAALAHLARDAFKLELVDVLREPARALAEGVLVTPTLVKVSPVPERRIIGNLRDREALVIRLEIPASAS